MAMIVLSSPATLTGPDEKKTGPSRFIADFLTELTKLSKFRIYKRACTRFTRSLQQVYTNQTRIIHSVYTKNTLSEQSVYTEYTRSEQMVHQPIPLPPLKSPALRLPPLDSDAGRACPSTQPERVPVGCAPKVATLGTGYRFYGALIIGVMRSAAGGGIPTTRVSMLRVPFGLKITVIRKPCEA
jgi:hypothetical protein